MKTAWADGILLMRPLIPSVRGSEGGLACGLVSVHGYFVPNHCTFHGNMPLLCGFNKQTSTNEL
jgi:hypothetical protein